MGAERILVTGAAGFLGRAVVDRLAARGRTVRAAVRHAATAATAGATTVAVGDLSSDTDWINTPIGFSNGFVTHLWMIAAFLTARPSLRAPASAPGPRTRPAV